MKKAEEMFRKSQVTSFYSSEFGSIEKSNKPENNIFYYRKCSDVFNI